ncbi:hypothetical protein [Leptospira alstonii]|uniref:Uncharacterized protein n=2 Tax=Leptospira alstonii TaxID=28452 RepID=M6CWB2_9LEPT|nr:hypothetical protein [Leptospira alstonii]EMJ94796.1 hypothetical protein LEP1GSC194_3172 [Leptospira alstonii serovar Sichuan str. 79601]EQA81058.1 hypothetical protein LEP1GSC193_2348 [Leptospira alstonii serovar Pingchang str. 80-412]
MRSKEVILENIDQYADEIRAKVKSLAQIRKGAEDNILYFAEASYPIDRLYSLIKDVEDALDFNQIRSLQYSYSVAVKGSLDEIFLPVGNASTILSSFQKTIKAFNKDAKLNLVNVLRGSTILCFDYSSDNYSDKKFNREEISKQFTELFLTLNEPKEKVESNLNKIFRNDDKKRDSTIKAFKGLTPIPGSETIIRIHPEFNDSESIEVHSEIREVINYIAPTHKKKDNRVDWDNFIVKGFVREINHVTKSFIMYEEQDSDDESGSLIKIHYDSGEFEDKILKSFPKKATIQFEKESGRSRYKVVKIF